MQIKGEPHTEASSALKILSNCICSSHHINWVKRTNTFSNIYLPQKKAPGKQHASMQHLPVTNPVVLLIHKNILWSGVKFLLWYEINIICVPINISIFIFLVYIYSQSPDWPFRYTLWSYLVSHNSISFMEDQPEELSHNWNSIKHR